MSLCIPRLDLTPKNTTACLEKLGWIGLLQGFTHQYDNLVLARKMAMRADSRPQAEEREQILALISQLEAHNCFLEPARNLHRVAGSWRLLFSTITILVLQYNLNSTN